MKSAPLSTASAEELKCLWLRPTFPQYRKIVGGKEKLLDGTETKETVIVKYDHSEEYKALLEKIVGRKNEIR